ncbi:MAG TPA: TolC family protein [Geobacteraceae bacterium]
MSLLLCLAASFSLAAVTAAHAVELVETPRPTGRGLTLEECLEIAGRNNHLRGASRFSIEIAEAQHRQALSGYWPEVGAKAAYTVMDHDPNFIFPARSITMPQGTQLIVQTPAGQMPISTLPIPEQNVKLMDRRNFYTTLSIDIPVYTGGRVTSIVRQTAQGMRAAKEEARRTDLQITYDVTRYYYGAVLARALLGIGRDTLARMEVTLELTEKLYTQGSGKVKKTDYLRNKTVVEWLRSAVSALEANEQMARAALTNAMGISWEAPAEPAEREIPFIPVKSGLKDLVSEAYLFSPDWASLDAGLAAAEAKIDEARSGHLPKLGLFGSFTRVENPYEGGIVTSENKTSWTVGVGIELPLFNGLRTVNEVREARARLARLKEQQLLLKEGIALQVKHIFIQMMSAQEQKVSSQAAAQAAEENRGLNERAYQEELVETKDVIEAQLMESLMKAQYQKSLYDNIDARANLAYVVGREMSELIRDSR